MDGACAGENRQAGHRGSIQPTCPLESVPMMNIQPNCSLAKNAHAGAERSGSARALLILLPLALLLTACGSSNSYTPPSPDEQAIVSIQQIAMTDNKTCVLGNTLSGVRRIQCWGDFVPGFVDDAPFPEEEDLVELGAIAAGIGHSCVTSANGLLCWGQRRAGAVEVPDGVEFPSVLAAGYDQTCVIEAAVLRCWGWGNEGQNDVPPLNNPTAIAIGNHHVCAIDDNGVQCWGANAAPETGINQGQTQVPAAVGLASRIAAGNKHSCALHDNRVTCWGDNSYGQLNVPFLLNPVALAAGANHNCAIDDTGIVCWGQDDLGQLQVPAGLQNPRALYSGRWHTCAVVDRGVACWGDNRLRQSLVPEELSNFQIEEEM